MCNTNDFIEQTLPGIIPGVTFGLFVGLFVGLSATAGVILSPGTLAFHIGIRVVRTSPGTPDFDFVGVSTPGYSLKGISL